MRVGQAKPPRSRFCFSFLFALNKGFRRLGRYGLLVTIPRRRGSLPPHTSTSSTFHLLLFLTFLTLTLTSYFLLRCCATNRMLATTLRRILRLIRSDATATVDTSTLSYNGCFTRVMGLGRLKDAQVSNFWRSAPFFRQWLFRTSGSFDATFDSRAFLFHSPTKHGKLGTTPSRQLRRRALYPEAILNFDGRVDDEGLAIRRIPSVFGNLENEALPYRTCPAYSIAQLLFGVVTTRCTNPWMLRSGFARLSIPVAGRRDQALARPELSDGIPNLSVNGRHGRDSNTQFA